MEEESKAEKPDVGAHIEVPDATVALSRSVASKTLGRLTPARAPATA